MEYETSIGRGEIGEIMAKEVTMISVCCFAMSCGYPSNSIQVIKIATSYLNLKV